MSLFSFENIVYSYFLNDLAMSLCDFILNATKNSLSRLESARFLLKGYESEFEPLNDLQKELLHNLILFNCILLFTKHDIKNEYFSIFDEIYLDSNFLN
jgi:Ser/Thr protein kinase RdoA (MazF antagonist)